MTMKYRSTVALSVLTLGFTVSGCSWMSKVDCDSPDADLSNPMCVAQTETKYRDNDNNRWYCLADEEAKSWACANSLQDAQRKLAPASERLAKPASVISQTIAQAEGGAQNPALMPALDTIGARINNDINQSSADPSQKMTSHLNDSPSAVVDVIAKVDEIHKEVSDAKRASGLKKTFDSKKAGGRSNAATFAEPPLSIVALDGPLRAGEIAPELADLAEISVGSITPSLGDVDDIPSAKAVEAEILLPIGQNAEQQVLTSSNTRSKTSIEPMSAPLLTVQAGNEPTRSASLPASAIEPVVDVTDSQALIQAAALDADAIATSATTTSADLVKSVEPETATETVAHPFIVAAPSKSGSPRNMTSTTDITSTTDSELFRKLKVSEPSRSSIEASNPLMPKVDLNIAKNSTETSEETVIADIAHLTPSASPMSAVDAQPEPATAAVTDLLKERRSDQLANILTEETVAPSALTAITTVITPLVEIEAVPVSTATVDLPVAYEIDNENSDHKQAMAGTDTLSIDSVNGPEDSRTASSESNGVSVAAKSGQLDDLAPRLPSNNPETERLEQVLGDPAPNLLMTSLSAVPPMTPTPRSDPNENQITSEPETKSEPLEIDFSPRAMASIEVEITQPSTASVASQTVPDNPIASNTSEKSGALKGTETIAVETYSDDRPRVAGLEDNREIARLQSISNVAENTLVITSQAPAEADENLIAASSTTVAKKSTPAARSGMAIDSAVLPIEALATTAESTAAMALATSAAASVRLGKLNTPNNSDLKADKAETLLNSEITPPTIALTESNRPVASESDRATDLEELQITASTIAPPATDAVSAVAIETQRAPSSAPTLSIAEPDVVTLAKINNTIAKETAEVRSETPVIYAQEPEPIELVIGNNIAITGDVDSAADLAEPEITASATAPLATDAVSAVAVDKQRVPSPLPKLPATEPDVVTFAKTNNTIAQETAEGRSETPIISAQESEPIELVIGNNIAITGDVDSAADLAEPEITASGKAPVITDVVSAVAIETQRALSSALTLSVAEPSISDEATVNSAPAEILKSDIEKSTQTETALATTDSAGQASSINGVESEVVLESAETYPAGTTLAEIYTAQVKASNDLPLTYETLLPDAAIVRAAPELTDPSPADTFYTPSEVQQSQRIASESILEKPVADVSKLTGSSVDLDAVGFENLSSPSSSGDAGYDYFMDLPANDFAIQLKADKTLSGIRAFATEIKLTDPLVLKTQPLRRPLYILILDTFNDIQVASDAKRTWMAEYDNGIEPWIRTVGSIQKTLQPLGPMD